MRKAEILAIEPLTRDVHRFRLSRPDGFAYESGDATELALDRDGWRDEARPFTMTSLPDEDSLEFTIKRYPDHDGVTLRLHELLVGDAISPKKAKKWGLINKVVPDGEALAAARVYADKIAANGPLAVVGIKEAVLASDGLAETDAFAKEMEIGMVVMASADAKEGPKAFLEKRTPDFQGK